MGGIIKNYGLDSKLDSIIASEDKNIESVRMLLHLGYWFWTKRIVHNLKNETLDPKTGDAEEKTRRIEDFVRAPHTQESVFFYEINTPHKKIMHKVHIGRFPVEIDQTGRVAYSELFDYDKMRAKDNCKEEFVKKQIKSYLAKENSNNFQLKEYHDEHKYDFFIQTDPSQEIQDQLLNHIIMLRNITKNITLYLPTLTDKMEEPDWFKNDKDLKDIDMLLAENKYKLITDVDSFAKKYGSLRKEKEFCTIKV